MECEQDVRNLTIFLHQEDPCIKVENCRRKQRFDMSISICKFKLKHFLRNKEEQNFAPRNYDENSYFSVLWQPQKFPSFVDSESVFLLTVWPNALFFYPKQLK